VAQSDSNYLLLKSSGTPDYTLCQMRSWLSSDCSTQYNVSGTAGGHLRSHCELPQDGLSYRNTVPDTPAFTKSTGYRDVAAQLLTSLALNTGVSNANASSTRLLSQLMPIFGNNETKFTLSPVMPSLAEALAVISGSEYFHPYSSLTIVRTHYGSRVIGFDSIKHLDTFYNLNPWSS